MESMRNGSCVFLTRILVRYKWPCSNTLKCPFFFFFSQRSSDYVKKEKTFFLLVTLWLYGLIALQISTTQQANEQKNHHSDIMMNKLGEKEDAKFSFQEWVHENHSKNVKQRIVHVSRGFNEKQTSFDLLKKILNYKKQTSSHDFWIDIEDFQNLLKKTFQEK